MPSLPLPGVGRIHYAERGQRQPGRPTALFIHGAAGGAAIWGMIVARVARAGHAVALDLPGHGPRAPGDGQDVGELSLARYRDAVGALAAALGLGPLVLVGHSLGAWVAIEAALAWPDQVRALILCAAAPRMGVDPALVALLGGDPARTTAWLADNGLSPRAQAALGRGLVAAGPLVSAEVARADFAIVRDADLGPRLPGVRCPITWIDGTDDRIVPPAARAVPRPGRIVTVPDAGHLLPIEAPAVIAEAVIESLSG